MNDIMKPHFRKEYGEAEVKKLEKRFDRLEEIKNYEEQIAILKNAAAQKWKTEKERKRLIEESVKLEVKVIAMKNAEK